MKKILFLANCPSPYRVRFFDILGRDADVTVLFWERREEVTDRDAAWFISGEGNFRQVQLEKRSALLGGAHVDVIDWLKKPFDHIIICGYSAPTAMLAIHWLKSHRRSYCLEVDGGLIRQESGPKLWLKKYLVGGASLYLSTGKRTSEYLVHYGAREDRVRCYPFTSLEEKDILSSPVTREEKQALRQKLGMGEEKIVLSVGQFIPRKGFDVLLKAAAGLPADTGVYIVGGEPTEAYRTLAKGLDHVHFCGFKKKEALAEYYRAADLFVLPTREDIWGLVINEAMSCGLPVITTDNCVAGLELIREGVNGAIVPADDAAALEEKMKEILAGDMEAMGRAALATAGEYTIEAMAKAHLDILEGR